MAKPLIAAAPEMGHNAPRPRLELLAEDARKGLARVAKGEDEAIEGWLIYGAALNQGRDQFPVGDNARFSEWVSNSQLAIWPDGSPIGMDERAAAMWAAEDRERFEALRRAHPRVRTVRGIHAKWKEIEAEREQAAAREAAECARREAEQRAQEEAYARQREHEARTEAERREARERAEQAAKARREAENDASEAETRVRPDSSELREALHGAVADARRAPSNRNPLYRADAARDAVIEFTGNCRRVAEVQGLEALAAFDGADAFRTQMMAEARAAARVLARFLEMAGDE